MVHLVEVHYTNGRSVCALSEDATPATAIKDAPSVFKGMDVMSIDSAPVNGALLAVLEAHPGVLGGYEQSTTDVLIACQGSECFWEATITGKQDKRGHGHQLFMAHQAVMVQEAFALSARPASDEDS